MKCWPTETDNNQNKPKSYLEQQFRLPIFKRFQLE